MVFKNKWFQLGLALMLGIGVLLLPRPEGTKFKVSGDPAQELLRQVGEHFVVVPQEKPTPGTYTLQARNPGTPEATAKFLKQTAGEVELKQVEIGYVDGLSPKAKRFLAVLAVLHLSLRGRADPAGDHRHLHRRLPGRPGHRSTSRTPGRRTCTRWSCSSCAA